MRVRVRPTGYLAFREAPVLGGLVARLRTERPDLQPDVVMVDGNGVLHPAQCGLASVGTQPERGRRRALMPRRSTSGC